jgi:hypothetical protein
MGWPDTDELIDDNDLEFDIEDDDVNDDINIGDLDDSDTPAKDIAASYHHGRDEGGRRSGRSAGESNFDPDLDLGDDDE